MARILAKRISVGTGVALLGETLLSLHRGWPPAAAPTDAGLEAILVFQQDRHCSDHHIGSQGGLLVLPITVLDKPPARWHWSRDGIPVTTPHCPCDIVVRPRQFARPGAVGMCFAVFDVGTYKPLLHYTIGCSGGTQTCPRVWRRAARVAPKRTPTAVVIRIPDKTRDARSGLNNLITHQPGSVPLLRLVHILPPACLCVPQLHLPKTVLGQGITHELNALINVFRSVSIAVSVKCRNVRVWVWTADKSQPVLKPLLCIALGGRIDWWQQYSVGVCPATGRTGALCATAVRRIFCDAVQVLR